MSGKNRSIHEDKLSSWDHNATILVLDEYQRRITDIRNPLKKKIIIWDQIAKSMNAKGYRVDGDGVDRKIRNMKSTFNKIKDNHAKRVSGKGVIHWPYYHKCYNIFTDDPSANTMFDLNNSTVEEELIEEEEDKPSEDDAKPLEGELGNIERIIIYADDQNEDKNFSWDHLSTSLLLDEYEHRIEQFRNPLSKKMLLWSDIAEVMNAKGYNVVGDVLDKKMRNMKVTFNKIKSNQSKRRPGKKAVIHWQYYERFCNLFDDDTFDTNNFKSSLPLFVTTQYDSDNASDSANVLSPHSNSSADGYPQYRPSASNSRKRQKKLDDYRRQQLDIEQQRLEETKKIRLEMEESNRINREKLKLFKEYMQKNN